MQNKEIILAIESSCDESAFAIFDSEIGIIKELIHTQIDLHKLYGGVVPDIASTEHLKKLPALAKEILEGFDSNSISTIAVTNSPGLPNCLAMGVSCASALSLYLNKPLIGVNHLRGHCFSPFIPLHKDDPANFESNFKALLPHLGLIVSGGNTMLVEIDENCEIHLLSETLDDAAGEALDKGAKLLSMPYPGGPLLEKEAKKGDEKKYIFPTAMKRKEGKAITFSFSGLKTSLRYFLDKLSPQEIKDNYSDICASYQRAVIEQLKRKTQAFSKEKSYKSLGLSGGVSNNEKLRIEFDKLAKSMHCKLYTAQREHRGDNASMIAFAAWIDKANTQEPASKYLKINPSAGI
ncbi:MAG: tRNA (adenosine(37)-N6)-threonylcarbamoyltransferase complex transferase subunit TsaD [Opitutales bacterium]